MRCPTIQDLPQVPIEKTGWPWTEESRQVTGLMPDGQPWPRVSIITPSYNQSEYIEETIRSVLLQGYPDLEYIIIDGGSTDGSVEIIRKYAPWLAYWVSEPDDGQGQAINNGWSRASGNILAYINSDDQYRKGAITAAAEGHHTRPTAGMVYGSAVVIDEAGKELRVWQGQPFGLRAMLLEGNVVPQPAAFFTAHALEKVGFLDEQWHMIMDYELCIRIGLEFPSVCLPEHLAIFRDHVHSKTNMRFEETTRELVQFLDAFHPEQIPADEMRRLKRAALSRIHYELAMNYLARGRQFAPLAVRGLIKSAVNYPYFPIKRPLDTAYILKEVMLSYLSTPSHRSTHKGMQSPR